MYLYIYIYIYIYIYVCIYINATWLATTAVEVSPGIKGVGAGSLLSKSPKDICIDIHVHIYIYICVCIHIFITYIHS
jgi:hypothetical protein